MKSPFTGGKVSLEEEPSSIIYKGKRIEYIYSYYQCIDTNAKYTTTELDNYNMYKVIAEYNRLMNVKLS